MIKFLGHERISLDELETFPGNANIGNIPMILESLISNGQYRSLIVRRVDGRNVVLAGNHTKLAMVEHGPGECEDDECMLCEDDWTGEPRCEVFEMSDEEATKINLADNRISEFSKRDDQALADLLMSIEDLTGSGYNADDLRLYLPQEPPSLEELHEEYGDVEDEATPVLPVLSFRVTPALRDLFLEMTEDADDPSDPVSRFTYQIGRAHV